LVVYFLLAQRITNNINNSSLVVASSSKVAKKIEKNLKTLSHLLKQNLAKISFFLEDRSKALGQRVPHNTFV